MSTFFANMAERAWERGWLERQKRPIKHGKPGEFFNNLSEEEKARLRTLTSDQARNIRFDAIELMCEPPHDENGFPKFPLGY
jgi:hypothetical protein